jgi:putative iron-regulated protein
MNKLIICISTIATISLSLNSCKPKETGPSSELKKAAINNYAAIVYANYSDALTKAQNLKTAIDAFVASPSQTTLDVAKQAWLDARVPYGQTESYRFSDGPIDDATGPESFLNSWPMDEAFVDYVQGNSTAGIINNLVTYPTISKSVIEGLNTSGGETNISCGYHAVEFLLWGQDLSSVSAGTRPYTDYVTVGGTALNQARRGQYLKACAELIVDHLQTVTTAWSPSVAGNYRNSFVNGDANSALAKIIQGCGFLSKGELAGERLEVAYDSQLQEDEHSCFSDNTTNDIRMNALAIYNVFNGSYTRTDGTVISGTSIYDVVKAKDATVADAAKTAIQDGKDKAYLIDAPFDQQILSSNPTGRQKIKNAIDAIKLQGDKIALAANALGLTIVIQ